MRTLVQQLRRVASTSANVLLIGESGTGKEMAARALHELGLRPRAPLITVNCGSIPHGLFEAELFGYERGSFTGALKSQAGHFERAGAGTLFLDEIAEMPVELQVKLLRVLETHHFRRVGGERELKYQCRIIAATNREPHQAVLAGRLRPDLLYRLGNFPISLPPLRERDGDAALLANYFLDELNAQHGSWKRLSAESLCSLVDYPWPGNVRELRNAVKRAFILADNVLHLRPALSTIGEILPAATDTVRIPIGTSLADAEQSVVVATLAQCAGNKTRTAGVLGCSLKTLYNRLHSYGEI